MASVPMNIGTCLVVRFRSEMKEKSREYKNSGLEKVLFKNIICKVFIPFVIVMSLLFLQAREKMKEQAITNINQRVSNISKEIKVLFDSIQLISDRYAYDSVMEQYTGTYYGVDLVNKRKDIYELKQILENTLRIGNNMKFAAIYTKYGELFNFLEPEMDGVELIDQLLNLGIADKKNLSIIKWHSLTSNILLSKQAPNIRDRNIILGARRLVNPFSGEYSASQIFVFTEQDIYDKYSAIFEGISGDVYIVNGMGEVVSGTDPNKINQKFSKEILDKINQSEGFSYNFQYEGEKHLVSTSEISELGWKAIAMIPVTGVTKTIDLLFINILLILAICILLCMFMIIHISRKFLKPIDILSDSMKAVYNGNMMAYVEMKGHGEIQKMGRYYNSMLKQINHSVEEQIETEKNKKQLELEVLMGQINPHFLYNTLENIVWKSSEAGSPDIGRMAASLGRMYRLSISNGDIIVKVQQEIEHLMAYINIQKMRYKERVDFELIMDHEEIRPYMTIKMTLQPAVENCFMYGMEDIERTLNIKLVVKVRKDKIHFIILDNGSGMTKLQLEKARDQIATGAKRTETGGRRKSGTGIGLYSIKERNRIYFGEENGVKIYSKKGIGTLVRITIPKKDEIRQ